LHEEVIRFSSNWKR